jgi:hypothetical protein
MKLEAFRPGHVFLMPAGATWLNRDKPRPYVLGTACTPDQRGTLIYGSTRETEHAAFASHVQVMPRPSGVNANGLRERTLFYPGVLLPTRYALLPPHTGSLGPALHDLRRALHRAVGIGAGTPPHSRRGRIVRLHRSFETMLRTRHAVLLTEHRYSREDRYQVIVPIIRGDGVREDESVVRVSKQPWFEIFSEPASTALLAAPVIQSVWHRDDIVGETGFVIDSESLDALEERLCRIFRIDIPPE